MLWEQSFKYIFFSTRLHCQQWWRIHDLQHNRFWVTNSLTKASSGIGDKVILPLKAGNNRMLVTSICHPNTIESLHRWIRSNKTSRTLLERRIQKLVKNDQSGRSSRDNNGRFSDETYHWSVSHIQERSNIVWKICVTVPDFRQEFSLRNNFRSFSVHFRSIFDPFSVNFRSVSDQFPVCFKM